MDTGRKLMLDVGVICEELGLRKDYIENVVKKNGRMKPGAQEAEDGQEDEQEDGEEDEQDKDKKDTDKAKERKQKRSWDKRKAGSKGWSNDPSNDRSQVKEIPQPCPKAGDGSPEASSGFLFLWKK
ncbi:hypothetical protein [Paenibacillus sp. RC84]|uniref:hypothetical protein n=1 Tax=Paenibacillus sp. RC84 TaxID=3156252 RepID=UPI0035153C91